PGDLAVQVIKIRTVGGKGIRLTTVLRIIKDLITLWTKEPEGLRVERS
ncbi:hypothetical protein A2U01_0112625, partial [Trifolium medium]|nr:hypothetical protein [Trifolium medium]